MNNFLKKSISAILALVLSLNIVGVALANASTETENISETEVTSESVITSRAAPLVPILGFILRKAVKEAVEYYGKQAVINAVMDELNLPKTISGKNLVKKLQKVGFEKLRQNGSHITMKGPNGKTFVVPNHTEIAKGTYNKIKKEIKDSIAP